MTLTERPDGSWYPSDTADSAVLREETCPDAQTEIGYGYHRTIGDLVVDVLVGRPMVDCSDFAPENWETIEHAMLVNAGLEIKAINAGLVQSTCNDDSSDEVSARECSVLLRALSRRIEAGAELARRLRKARWGHPNFGGGEGWEAKTKADAGEAEAEKAEAANG